MKHLFSLRMAARRLALFVFVSGMMANFWPRPACAAELGWKPARTWVFAVGLVKFKEKEMFGSFPTKDRRDERLIQFFTKRGVPKNQIVYLQDKKATLSAIKTSFTTLLRKTGPNDTLFLYYEGHGYRSEDKTKTDAFFAVYDTDGENVSGWSVNSIPQTINRYFKGSRAILTADCCYSGYMAQIVNKNRGSISYACITSSSAREVSTGHWTFTDCLLDAFNGASYDEDYPRFVSFSPSGKQILSGGGDPRAKVWDAQTGKRLRTFGPAGN